MQIDQTSKHLLFIYMMPFVVLYTTAYYYCQKYAQQFEFTHYVVLNHRHRAMREFVCVVRDEAWRTSFIVYESDDTKTVLNSLRKQLKLSYRMYSAHLAAEQQLSGARRTHTAVAVHITIVLLGATGYRIAN